MHHTLIRREWSRSRILKENLTEQRDADPFGGVGMVLIAHSFLGSFGVKKILHFAIVLLYS